MYRLLTGEEDQDIQTLYIPTEKFNNSQVKMLKNQSMTLDLWDINGRLPHLWGHYYTGGVQGIIYVVRNLVDDDREAQKYYLQVQEQLLNIIINNFEVPLVIYVNTSEPNPVLDLQWF